jgi:serine protease AprX
LGYDPQHKGSLSLVTRITGAQALWDQGFTGQGVGVAVIDTGVTRVPGLDRPGQVIDGADLSFDSQEPTLQYSDAFGHGTAMASIIAGSDISSGVANSACKTCLGASAYTDTTKFVGVAPDSHIVNVKVGAFDGAVDVSQMIAAIYWVVDHRNDPGVNIRVLNLSYGTDSTQSPSIDPLVRAVEYAWNSGIVVVVAAGNEGKNAPTLATPATSPLVIAVGSTDSQDTVRIGDDKVSDFAQHGTLQRSVDFVTPGRSVLGLKVPGSFVDQNTTTGRAGTRFQRGSGTSQATATVSGLAALVISKFPTATPDQIKSFLRNAALPFKSTLDGKGWFLGTGEANVADAVGLLTLPVVVPSSGTLSNGLGSLEASRGSYHVSVDGVALTGEMDIFAQPWTPATTPMTWSGGMWNGARWSGDAWDGARWSGALWSGARWSAGSWDGARWSAMAWDGARWSGARWSGARWSSGTWDGARWSGLGWSDAAWE